MSTIAVCPQCNTQMQLVKTLGLPQEAYKSTPVKWPKTAKGARVEKVWRRSDGTLLVKFENMVVPRKGLLNDEALADSDVFKKYIKAFVKLATARPGKYTESFLSLLADFGRSVIQRHALDEGWYAPPIRELLRTIKALHPGDEVAETIANCVGCVLYVDVPYLYRLQDIMNVVNKSELEKRPAREIRRVLRIFAERDGQRSWKGLANLAWLIVVLRPSIRRWLKRFAREINIQPFFFEAVDLYWCLRNDDPSGKAYNYLGMDKEKRLKLWTEIHNDFNAVTQGK